MPTLRLDRLGLLLPALALLTANAAIGSVLEAPEVSPVDAKGTSPDLSAACAGGIVDDDGSAETGYGWVPSVTEGVFIQEYSGSELPTGKLASVCVCWLRTRSDDSLDFEVVLYESTLKKTPVDVPYAAFPAQVTGLPPGFAGAAFTEVDLGAVAVPDGTFFVGVRWDASVDQFFFVCADQTAAAGPPTRVYFRDDRALGWGVSDMTRDPIFLAHQAMMVRLVAAPDLVTVPVGPSALALLAALMALAGAALLRRS